MYLKDNYVSISGVYIKYYKADTVAGTPTLLHSTLESRRGGPRHWAKVKGRGYPSFATHLALFGTKIYTLSSSQEFGTDKCQVSSPGSLEK